MSAPASPGRSSRPRSGTRCPGCFLIHQLCLCPEIPRVETRMRLQIVRHYKERMKSSNTGRLAGAALPRAELLDYGLQDAPFDDGVLDPDAWLLFPPELDHDGQETGRHRLLSGPLSPPPRTVVVLDGTWGQARRMSHRIQALDAMPRYQLPPPAEAPRRLRRGPTPAAMATLEAIARLVEVFEGPEAAAPLDQLFAEFVRRLRAASGR